MSIDNEIEEIITKDELSRLGRYMAASRRIVDGTCEVCGKTFTGTTKRRYCSNSCVVRAHRARVREAQVTIGKDGFSNRGQDGKP